MKHANPTQRCPCIPCQYHHEISETKTSSSPTRGAVSRHTGWLLDEFVPPPCFVPWNNVATATTLNKRNSGASGGDPEFSGLGGGAFGGSGGAGWLPEEGFAAPTLLADVGEGLCLRLWRRWGKAEMAQVLHKGGGQSIYLTLLWLRGGSLGVGMLRGLHSRVWSKTGGIDGLYVRRQRRLLPWHISSTRSRQPTTLLPRVKRWSVDSGSNQDPKIVYKDRVLQRQPCLSIQSRETKFSNWTPPSKRKKVRTRFRGPRHERLFLPQMLL